MSTQAQRKNGIGIAGFILSLIALILCWIPILSQILFIIGLIFSIAGVLKPNRGMAIAGVIISAILTSIYFLILGAIS